MSQRGHVEKSSLYVPHASPVISLGATVGHTEPGGDRPGTQAPLPWLELSLSLPPPPAHPASGEADREGQGSCWGCAGGGVGGAGWASSAWMSCPHGAPGRCLLPHRPHPGAEFGPGHPTDGGHRHPAACLVGTQAPGAVGQGCPDYQLLGHTRVGVLQRRLNSLSLSFSSKVGQ